MPPRGRRFLCLSPPSATAARSRNAAAAASPPRACARPAERRAQRALAAAQTKYEAGALDDALALLRVAEAGASPSDVTKEAWGLVELIEAAARTRVARTWDRPHAAAVGDHQCQRE
jgi:hypothetical protein